MELSDVHHLDQLVTYVGQLERRVCALEEAADSGHDGGQPDGPKPAKKAAKKAPASLQAS